MNQISLKTIFKEPIFTAVEGKSPVCYSTIISVHVHLSEHTVQRQSSCRSHVEGEAKLLFSGW